MTEFERNARYSYDEKLAQLKEKGFDGLHLQTLSYNGYEVITNSKLGKGVRYYFYKDKKLVKIRNWNWKTDIMLYAKRYIDQELKRKENT